MSATSPPRRSYAIAAAVLFIIAYVAMVGLILTPKELLHAPPPGALQAID
ncbi:hypothetical protein Q9295_16520 [Xinfangfangia sp. CPCC 101601]|uniref:Uncharacterized protein n=1 Tax=Pseudogemmobacter lacusdianii TaxID=3069608 RepID=A0ABU0W4J1_9RHOB|nr:hypothetical protein [Xinfangfangia sp. CPCC 101601]MDQ2067980.1 hypothetical protein [Xinfangfangia sp. CPCC 101601]